MRAHCEAFATTEIMNISNTSNSDFHKQDESQSILTSPVTSIRAPHFPATDHYQTTQQEASKASSILTASPMTHLTASAPTPVGSAAALDSHRNSNAMGTVPARELSCVLLLRL